jgi:hypothetical protein
MTLSTENYASRQSEAVDNLPEEYDDTVTLANARFWDRPAPYFSRKQTELLTAVLLAWESSAISGFQAISHLDEHGVFDCDHVLSLMLDDIRSRARREIG